jgi:hypothetical protein
MAGLAEEERRMASPAKMVCKNVCGYILRQRACVSVPEMGRQKARASQVCNHSRQRKRSPGNMPEKYEGQSMLDNCFTGSKPKDFSPLFQGFDLPAWHIVCSFSAHSIMKEETGHEHTEEFYGVVTGAFAGELPGDDRKDGGAEHR